MYSRQSEVNRLGIPWVNSIWERHYSSGALPTSSNRVGSFWWKDILKLLDSFKGLAMVNVFDGRTCLFWNDLWFNKVPRLHYPQLFSFAQLALNAEALEDFLHLPLSPVARGGSKGGARGDQAPLPPQHQWIPPKPPLHF